MNNRIAYRAFFIIGTVVTLFFFLKGGHYSNFLLATILVYTLVAMSLRILTGFGGQVSIGHAGFWAIGAYTSGLLVVKLGMPFLVGMLLSGIIAAIFGALVALPALRVRGHYLAIATLAFAFFIQQGLFEWESLTGGRHGLYVPRPEILGITLETDLAYNCFLLPVVILFGWITENFRKSHTGIALNALKMSNIAGQTAGISRTHHLFVAFMMSAFYTGVSGALYAHLIGYLSTETFTLGVSLSFLTMAVIGGFGSFLGPILGAVFLTLSPEIFRELKSAQMVVYGVTLVLCMRFLPGGLASLFYKGLKSPDAKKI